MFRQLGNFLRYWHKDQSVVAHTSQDVLDPVCGELFEWNDEFLFYNRNNSVFYGFCFSNSNFDGNIYSSIQTLGIYERQNNFGTKLIIHQERFFNWVRQRLCINSKLCISVLFKVGLQRISRCLSAILSKSYLDARDSLLRLCWNLFWI